MYHLGLVMNAPFEGERRESGAGVGGDSTFKPSALAWSAMGARDIGTVAGITMVGCRGPSMPTSALDAREGAAIGSRVSI
jgi:hypothetical protein